MPSDHARRDDLIEKVVSGETPPSEAEAEATRLGLKAIEYRPDPADYDPMTEVFWTLPMTAAWIAYRTVDAARQWCQTYREQCWHWLYQDRWKGSGRSGYQLVQRSDSSLGTLRISDTATDRSDRDLAYSMTVPDAIDALSSALKKGKLLATGVFHDSGLRQTIMEIEWIDLRLSEASNSDGLELYFPDNHSFRGYRDVLVSRTAICDIWGTRRTLPRPLTLGELMRPEGGGYMPVYCAAQWIATNGGTIDFDPLETARWVVAFRELLDRVSSDEVKIVGFRDGMRELVPGYHFAGIKVSYPFVDTPVELIMGNENYLQSFTYCGEQHWLEGYNDSLETPLGVKWSRLVVMKQDVAAYWSYGDGTGGNEDTDSSTYRSGGPGRPSAMHLVKEQFESRSRSGLIEKSITKEAEALAAWIKLTHPRAHPISAKTIRNSLSSAIRLYLNARK